MAEDIKEKVAEAVKEKQKAKEFKDTSIVEYTRKYQAQYDIITAKDLTDIEKDPITAYKLIDKAKVWPVYVPEQLKEQGLNSGSAYLAVKVRESLTSKPEDNAKARELYVESVAELRTLLQTPSADYEIKEQLYIFYKKYGKIITDALLDKSKFRFLSGDYIDDKTLERVWGKRFINQIKFSSESAKTIFLEANMFNSFSVEESQKIKEIKKSRANDIVVKYKELLSRAKESTTAAQLGAVLSTFYRSYDNKKSLEDNKELAIGIIEHVITRESNLAKNPSLKPYELPREGDWSWTGIKKEDKPKEEKDQWTDDLFDFYGIKKNIKTIALDFIKRTGGLPVPEITVESIRKYFGYSDVVFGNYVRDKESKEHVRHFLGAMVDLAELLNVDIKAINEFGNLSIFFGALGCGSFTGAMACYYPSRKAINLTKKTGDGSLAHEWSHYLDNISGESKEVRNDSKYGTLGGAYNDNAEIKEAFNKINSAIKNGLPFEVVPKFSKYKTKKFVTYRLYGTTAQECVDAIQRKHPNYKDYYFVKNNKDAIGYFRYIATKFDLENIAVSLTVKSSNYYYISSRYETGKQYFTNPKELFARAFEAYVEYKLEQQERASNYLVSIKNNLGLIALFAPKEQWPYPHGEELQNIVIAFDNLLKVFKREFNIGDFSWFSDIRQDEYIDLEKSKEEKVASGVIVTEENQVTTIDEKGDTQSEYIPDIFLLTKNEAKILGIAYHGVTKYDDSNSEYIYLGDLKLASIYAQSSKIEEYEYNLNRAYIVERDIDFDPINYFIKQYWSSHPNSKWHPDTTDYVISQLKGRGYDGLIIRESAIETEKGYNEIGGTYGDPQIIVFDRKNVVKIKEINETESTEMHSQEDAQIEEGEIPKETENSSSTQYLRSTQEEKIDKVLFDNAKVKNWSDLPINWKVPKPVNPVKYSEAKWTDKKFMDIIKVFASKDELKPALTGIYFDSKSKKVSVSDGHRLLITHTDHTDGNIHTIDGKNIIDAQYPDYLSVIPEKYNHVYEFDLLKLKTYCDACLNGRYCNETTKQVRFLAAQPIGFNIDYLLDCIEALMKIGYQTAHMGYNEPSKGIVLCPTAEEARNPLKSKLAILLMPVMISDYFAGSNSTGTLGTEDLDWEHEITAYFSFIDNNIHNEDGTLAEFDPLLQTTYQGLRENEYKALNSIMSKNPVVPILEVMAVVDNKAMATDLQSWLVLNEINLPNGLYILLNGALRNATDYGYDLEHFPKLPELLNEKTYFDISFEKLKTEFKRCIQAVSDDEMRPALTGVYLNTDKKEIVATNGMILYRGKLEIQTITKGTILMSGIQKYVKAMQYIECENVEIKADATRSKISCGSFDFISRQIDEMFPNYTEALPKDTDWKQFNLSRKQLTDCAKIKLSENIAIYKNKIEKITWDSQKPYLEKLCDATIERKQVTDSFKYGYLIMPVKNPGQDPDFMIAFNYGFINDIMKGLEQNNLSIQYVDYKKGAIIPVIYKEPTIVDLQNVEVVYDDPAHPNIGVAKQKPGKGISKFEQAIDMAAESQENEKKYFKDKLEAIKVAEKYASQDDKEYYKSLKQATKIALKYA